MKSSTTSSWIGTKTTYYHEMDKIHEKQRFRRICLRGPILLLTRRIHITLFYKWLCRSLQNWAIPHLIPKHLSPTFYHWLPLFKYLDARGLLKLNPNCLRRIHRNFCLGFFFNLAKYLNLLLANIHVDYNGDKILINKIFYCRNAVYSYILWFKTDIIFHSTFIFEKTYVICGPLASLGF